jgi:putative ABC transport system permease protein
MIRFLLACCRWLTDRSLAASIAGDLEEERQRRASRSRLQARLWIWREGLAILGHLAAERARSALRPTALAGYLRGSPGDVRHAFRTLGSSPWYSGTVIGVIALSMALATTVFAVVDGVLFKPLPYPTPDELYMVSGGYQRGQRDGIAIAPRNLRDWTASAPGSLMAAWDGGGGGPRIGDLHGWVPSMAGIDAHFFEVLGVQPIIGGFRPVDFEAELAVTPVIIGYGLWQSAFGGRPDVIGQALPTQGVRRYRVAGVLPRDFLFPITSKFTPNVLVPIVVPPGRRDDLRFRSVRGIARLPPSMTLAEYQARMDAAAKAEASDWVPRPSDGSPVFDRAGLVPFETELRYRHRPMFLTIFSAAAVLVLLGCLNISGLMASRAQDRRSELMLRRALGAGFPQIARLFLSESLVLATVGTVLGVAASRPLLQLTVRLLPERMGLLKTPAIDTRVLAFAALATMTVSLLISAWPILRSPGTAPAPLTNGAQVTTRVRSIGRFAVVATQVGVGLLLTLGGALVVSSLLHLRLTSPGFDVGKTLILEAYARPAPGPARILAIEKVLTELRQMPGVAAVGATQSPLLHGSMLLSPFTDGANHAVFPGFFEATGVKLLSGRLPADAELESGSPVIAISARVASRRFDQASPIGQSIDTFKGSFTIVGVVDDARFVQWDDDRRGQIYGSYAAIAQEQGTLSIVVRATGRPEALMPAIVRRLDGFSKDVQLQRMATAEDLLDDTVRGRRLDAWLFGAFGVAALTVVGVGVMGLMAMTTVRRTREIGIRMALGATGGNVIRLLVREVLWAVWAGVFAGAIVSAWTVGFVKSYLYQLTVYDVRVWIGAIGVILTVAALGALIPSWRASRTNPVAALRME